ncbi:uncharacterized protein LOC131247426 isoform X1 [Magnolia sinica]|uniref:uncharacterized protein LOC131247426 isoform X1 n=1 Tax=Magnolia sinica TaxID=86752 RepID=UPI00265832D9|nr:uncharacterized protein LOC131247426 isoform X1 [Magnolia sinica]
MFIYTFKEQKLYLVVLNECGYWYFQVGVAELKVAVERSGGLVVLAESFGHSVFKDSLKCIFQSTDYDFGLSFKLQMNLLRGVKRCAQVCVEKVFMSFESTVRKRASEMVWSLFNRNMPLAIELSAIRIVDGSKSELLSQSKHLEVLHMLNSLKLLFPFLSKKVTIKLLLDLYKLLGCHFSPLTRHILDILGVLFEFSRVDIPVLEVDNIIVSLVSHVSYGGENPVDTVMSASALLKTR